MKEIGGGASSSRFVRDVFEFGSWEVSYEDLSLTRWLSSYVFWEIPDSEINRVGRLVPKCGQLRLIGGYYDRDDGDIFLLSLFLDTFLFTGVNQLKFVRFEGPQTYLSSPPPLSRMHIMVHARRMVIICIVLFRLKLQVREELGI